jgi:fucose permease
LVYVLLYHGTPRSLFYSTFDTHTYQIAGSVVELLTSSLSFWKQTGAVYQAENPREPGAKTGRTREALKSQLTWIFALFIFGYVGAEGIAPYLYFLAPSD